MNRGEIWWVNFDPSIGSEIQKTRPAVIISNDKANAHAPRVQVVPVTSKIAKKYITEVYISVNDKRAKAMADQITTSDKSRLKSRICKISAQEMAGIEEAIKIQLGMN